MTPLPEETSPDQLAGAHFPADECRVIELEAELPHEAIVRQFLKEARRLRSKEVLEVPAGDFPIPTLSGTAKIVAHRAGGVRLVGDGNAKTLRIDKGGVVWLQGIEISPVEAGIPLVVVERGTLVLENCDVLGAIEVRGPEAVLFLRGVRITSAAVGVLLENGARADVEGARITGCHVGLSSAAGTVLNVRASRFEDCGHRDGANPGTGIHAEKEQVEIAGCVFLNNQIGVNLVECPRTTVSRSRFEANDLGGIMSRQGVLAVSDCAFRGQLRSDYAHITVESGRAVVTNCVFDGSAAAPEQVRIAGASAAAVQDESDLLASLISGVQELAAHHSTREALENLLHRTHARQQRRGPGLPGADFARHIVFESGDQTTTAAIAAVVAGAMQRLGVIAGDHVVEAELAPLVNGRQSPESVVQSAAGGVILLHAGAELESGLNRVTFETSRNRLIALARACRGKSLLIFAASRDFLRPLFGGSVECRTLFESIVPFPGWSPAELTEAFLSLCAQDGIPVTAEAAEKTLMIFHLFEDRRDRRFAGLEGVRKFFDLAQRRFLERCSRERNFALPLLPADIESPLDKSLDATQLGQPGFVETCPKCRAESPWVNGLPDLLICPACGHEHVSRQGTWTGSAFYKRGSAPVATVPAGGPRVIRRGAPVAG